MQPTPPHRTPLRRTAPLTRPRAMAPQTPDGASPEATGPALTPDDFNHLADEDIPPDFFEAPERPSEKILGMPRRVAYGVFAGAAVVALGILVFIVFATKLGWWPVVLDIVLVIAALTTTILLACLIYAIITLARVGLAIRDELVPVIRSIGETTGAVRDTARAATGYAVRPTARAVGLLTGALGTLGVLLGNRTATRAQARQKRRDEIERELAQEAQARLDREIGQQVRADIERQRANGEPRP